MQPRHLNFSSIASFDALLAAYRRARRAGRTRRGATEFDYNLESDLLGLQEELLAGRYRPGAYRSFFVHEPKRRLVSAAPFRDRVVHHALVGALEPLFERRFIHDSYACRRGKGTHRAVCRAHQFTRRYRFCLSTDVVRFFPSVDHELLLETVGRVLRCRRTLALVKTILDGGKDVLRSEFPDTLFPGDDLFALLRPRGLPIGNLTSQFLANVFLDPLDHFIKEQLRVRGYVRYADDLRVFHDKKRELHRIGGEIAGFLAQRRLVLHERKTSVTPCFSGIPFLGFVIYPGGRRRLSRDGVRRFRRRLRRAASDLESGRITPSDLTRSIQGWIAHAEHAQTFRLRKQIFSEVTFRCRRPSS